MTGNNIVDILLVEDNPNDVEMTLRALNKINIRNNIRVLSDGEEALQYLFGTGKFQDRDFNFNPKVVLLDLKMPKVDGNTN
jgi:CheY-like chemotaxis protein